MLDNIEPHKLKQMERRLRLSENTCKALRAWLTMKYCDRTDIHGSALCKHLSRWMNSVPKVERYSDPPRWPR